jgi:hypothetical protein
MTNAENNDWLVALFTEAASAPAYVPVAKIIAPADTPCTRCGGEGRISYYSHIKAGVCFACNGSGH